jgi:chromosome segregation protein
MGDVIFHGSDGRRPVSVAEVTLELSDGDREHMVRRRIYRDGVNEYYLDGSLVRLKDIQDFFLGTGIGLNSYAIVEQGKIEQFISMKPQERRILIEEASGITRFEEKKRQAAARLDEVRINLERVADIHCEVQQGLERAEVEWERWKAYRVLSEELAQVDLKILADGFRRIVKRLERIEERSRDLDVEVQRKEEEVTAVRQQREAKIEEFGAADHVARQLEVDLKGSEKDMEAKALEIDYVKHEREKLLKDLDERKKILRDLEAKVADLAGELRELAEERQRGVLEVESREAEARAGRNELEAFRKRVEECEQAMEETRVKLFVLMGTITDKRNRISEGERLNEERKAREERRAEERERLQQRLSVLKDRQTLLSKAHEQEKDEQGRLGEREKDLGEKLSVLAAALGEKRPLVEGLTGEQRGREEYLKQLAERGEPTGESPPGLQRLIDTIAFKEGDEPRTEQFFLREMEYFVLPGTDAAEISETVERYGVNFIFFPGRGIFLQRNGQVELNVHPVKGVEEALSRIAAGEEGIFCSGSSLIDSRGLILTDREGSALHLKRFRERVRIEQEVREGEERLAAAKAALGAVDEEHGRFTVELEGVKAPKERADREVERIERELLVAATELKTVNERLHELERWFDLYEEVHPGTLEGFYRDVEQLESERRSVEVRLAEEREGLERVKQEQAVSLSVWHEVSIALERQKARLSATMREIVTRDEALIELEKAISAGREKIDGAVALIEGLEGKEGLLEQDYESIREVRGREALRLEDLKTSLGVLHTEKTALDTRIDEVEKDKEKIRGRKEALEKESAIFVEKLEMIREKLLTSYGRTAVDDVPTAPQAELDDARERLQGRIEELGEVNFRADKEFHDLTERLGFLQGQKEDLEAAVDSLRKTIVKIDGLSKEKFLETFETISSSFKRFTEGLFKGGKGEVTLNHDTGGIEVFAQPPGKKVVRMELLSGGEKALVSLAFLLSLMHTRPSPFSLLDEIDAPLDDANLVNLMEIIREMAIRTQIVFITHNRITMGSSDTIYGITMEEEGISKTVSVRL